MPDILRTRHAHRNPGDLPVEHPSLVAFGKVFVTFAFICLGWVFFRAATFEDALFILQRIGRSFGGGQSWGGLLAKHDPTDGRILILIGCFVAVEWWKRRYLHALVFEHWSRPACWLAYTALFWLVIYLGTFGSSTFIYFQF